MTEHNNRIRNFTPHDVNIYSQNDCWYDEVTRKYRTNGEPMKIPSEGVLSVTVRQEENAHLTEALNNIPIYSMQVYGGDTKLPDSNGIGDEYFIVSKLFKDNTSERNKKRCLTVGPAVVDSSGRIVGCVGLVF